MVMQLTPQALAAVLPLCVSDPLEHAPEDKALAEAAISILSPHGSPREADGLRVAADLARDFRLLVSELQMADGGYKELRFGDGKLVITVGTFHGRPSVFVAPARIGGPIGWSASREGYDTVALVEGEVILSFPTFAQAADVADALVGSSCAETEVFRSQKRTQ